MRKNKSFYANAALFIALLLLDQGIKFILLRYYPSFISSNSGGAFGIGRGFDFYLIIASLILLLILVVYVFSEQKYKIPLILVLSGGVSNQLDRVLKNGVVDYIDIGIWPSFNFADSLIFVGICLVLLNLFKSREST